MRLFETREDFRSGTIGKQEYIQEMHELHSHLFEYADFIRETDIARIEITDSTVVMTSRSSGVRVYCDARDRRIPPIESLNFGGYERSEMDMTLRIIRPGFTVLDIGANIGWYSLNIAKAVPDSQIFAFEPIPDTYRQFVDNITLNSLNSVHAFNFGFSDHIGTTDFFFDPEVSVRASLAHLVETDHARCTTCRIRTVDDFIDEKSCPVDFIKCDVEGAELLVFRGARRTLERDRPAVFTEMLRKWTAKFGYHPNDIIQLFRELGYGCHTVSGTGLRPITEVTESTVETNFFFLHSEAHSALRVALTLGQSD
jgi:FkbM family methyltransferase